MLSFAGWWRGVADGIWAAVRRFPLPLAAGAVGAVAGVVAMRQHGNENLAAARVLLTAWLGLPLFLTAALVGQRGPGRTGLLSAVAAALLAGCYLGLAGHEDWIYIRFALFVLAAHAILALAPLTRPAPRGDFRPFNLMLFARTALALLLTHVLYAGLCFALEAVQHLFDLQVPDRLYPQLWFVLLGVFNTAYVLAGVPRDWDQLEGSFPTPRPLEVLARLVLLPLSLLYLAILYVYSVKILVVHQWPRGWVSAPIIVFAAIGMLTVLLLDAGRLTGSRLVRAYCRGFFVALLPLVVLLFLAISRRAFEYGLTEERCLVYAIAVFLAIIAPYFVLSRARRLAAIPLILAGMAIVTAVGPLSARSLAVRSQTARVRALLEKNHRLAHGVLVRSAHHVSRKDEHEIGAALMYLDSRQALGPVLAWRPTQPVKKNACSGCDALATAESPHDLTVALGLRYRPWRYEEDEPDTTERISAPLPPVLETTGFDFAFLNMSCSESGGGQCLWSYGQAPEHWAAQLEGTTLAVRHDRKQIARISLAEIERSAAPPDDDDDTRTQPKPIEQNGHDGTVRYRLFVSSLVFQHGEDGGPTTIAGLDGVLLLALDH
jgi:hypothetical protein